MGELAASAPTAAVRGAHAHAVRTTPVIGEALLHPISLLCLAVWGLNDHVLKARYGNWLTGKLSDFAGLLVFPLLLLTLLELGLWATGKRRKANLREWLAVLLVAGLGFTAAKCTTWGDVAYSVWVGLLHDPLATLRAPFEVAARVQHTQDPTDAIALPMLMAAWWFGKRSTV